MRKKILLVLITSAVMGSSVHVLADQNEPEVAYVEEIIVYPDGSQSVQQYRPGQKPLPVQIQGPRATRPRQRGLNRVEQHEIDYLERAFAHGEITESEYNQRKRDIYRSTFIGGAPDDDGLFNQHQSF